MTQVLFRQCDMHVHTRLSPCARGEMRIPAIAEAAEQRGIRCLGVTDHISVRTDPAILREARSEVDGLKTSIQVLLGCEADVLGVGRHVVTEEVRAAVDYVAVAANHFHADGVQEPRGLSLETIGRHYLEMFRYACTLDFADVIVHPMTVLIPVYDPTCLDLLKDDDLIEAIELAARNGIAMEISPRALIRDQMHFRLRFLSLCKQAGLKFSIGSDSHRLEDVGKADVLEPIVNELGITDSDIWLPESVLGKPRPLEDR